ncbi:hypothetical protein [Burkholderia cenocepacia]|uniref:hypothetical protein n=1 Tax=Burkholderia cenocepacia TaxID=95486 RepID=UPI0012376CB5|nr:hypothetical protein [Burkholderia cenocepacia]
MTDDVTVGTVIVPGYEDINDLDTRLTQISEAATGSILGLTDFAYENRGGSVVTFSGSVQWMLSNRPDDLTELDGLSEELKEGLAAQYGLSRQEVLHMLANVGCTRATKESSIPVWASGRSLHYPADLDALTYSRVVIDGLEVNYTSLSQAQFKPDVALGTLLDAAAGKVSDRD